MKNTEKKSGKRIGLNRSLIVAKVLACFAFFGSVFAAILEVVSFSLYVLPLWLTLLAQLTSISAETDLVVMLILWFFPGLFITGFMVILHFYLWKLLLGRVFSWFLKVLRQFD